MVKTEIFTMPDKERIGLVFRIISRTADFLSFFFLTKLWYVFSRAILEGQATLYFLAASLLTRAKPSEVLTSFLAKF